MFGTRSKTGALSGQNHSKAHGDSRPLSSPSTAMRDNVHALGHANCDEGALVTRSRPSRRGQSGGMRCASNEGPTLCPPTSGRSLGLAIRDGCQQENNHHQVERARPEVIHQCDSSKVLGKAPGRRRRKVIGPCGSNPHGTTAGWPSPCPQCNEGTSHEGERLCFACHSPPTYNGDNKEDWRHVQAADMAEAKMFWSNMKIDSLFVSRVKGGFEPGPECLCYRPDCFYSLFKLQVRKEAAEKVRRTCALCGTNKTTRWRKAGCDFSEMEAFFRFGDGAKKTRYYLACRRERLNWNSVICHKCRCYMRKHQHQSTSELAK